MVTVSNFNIKFDKNNTRKGGDVSGLEKFPNLGKVHLSKPAFKFLNSHKNASLEDLIRDGLEYLKTFSENSSDKDSK